jgi:hypothetical protein
LKRDSHINTEVITRWLTILLSVSGCRDGISGDDDLSARQTLSASSFAVSTFKVIGQSNPSTVFECGQQAEAEPSTPLPAGKNTTVNIGDTATTLPNTLLISDRIVLGCPSAAIGACRNPTGGM